MHLFPGITPDQPLASLVYLKGDSRGIQRNGDSFKTTSGTTFGFHHSCACVRHNMIGLGKDSWALGDGERILLPGG